MAEPERKPLSVSALKDAIDALRALGRMGVDIDELKKPLDSIFMGYWAECPTIPAGTLLYRAVPYEERPTHIGMLTYPPAEIVTRYGRVNRINQPVFYCSIAREAPFFEVHCVAGSKVALSRWRTKSRLLVQSVGNTKNTFERLASVRKNVPNIGVSDTQRTDEEAAVRALIHEFLSEEFTRDVAAGTAGDYTLSIAIAERLLGKIVNTKNDEQYEFGGIMYPAMRMRANADNFALLPTFVDEHMALEQVEYIRINAVAELQYKITRMDFANSWRPDGLILWQGQPKWSAGHGIHLVGVEDGSWVARDAEGNVVPFDGPGAEEPVAPPIPYLNDFTNDFPNALLLGNESNLQFGDGTESKLYSKMGYDLNKKEKFMAFFLPPIQHAFQVSKHLADIQAESQNELEKNAPGLGIPGFSKEWWKEFEFTGQMIVYCNANLEDEARQQLMKHFSAKNLAFEWRGADYLTGKFGVQ